MKQIEVNEAKLLDQTKLTKHNLNKLHEEKKLIKQSYYDNGPRAKKNCQPGG